MKISLFNIFKVFLKIGLILLGGGYVIIPIIQDELVKKRNWLTDDEVCDYYAVSQCLPGIIAINMAILVGYKLMKFKGALISVFAMSFTPFLSIVLIANVLYKIIKIPFIESVFWGVNLSVIVLIYLALKDIWKKSLTDYITAFWFILILILGLLGVNPAILIILSIIAGGLFQKIKDVKNV